MGGLNVSALGLKFECTNCIKNMDLEKEVLLLVKMDEIVITSSLNILTKLTLLLTSEY